jgi:hypothetical protein
VNINAEDDARPLWQRLPSMRTQYQLEKEAAMNYENQTLSVGYTDKESKNLYNS